MKMECLKRVGVRVKENEWKGMDTDANTILFLFCPQPFKKNNRFTVFITYNADL